MCAVDVGECPDLAAAVSSFERTAHALVVVLADNRLDCLLSHLLGNPGQSLLKQTHGVGTRLFGWMLATALNQLVKLS